MMNVIAKASFLLLIALLFAQGCFGRTPAPTKYYSLTAAETGPPERSPAGERGPTIALRPVDVPAYLDRPYIVTAAGPNEYRLSSANRWAEPFRDNVTRILARNISMLVPSDRVWVFSDRGNGLPDYVVQARINRFEGRLGEAATLEADWAVTKPAGGAPLAERRTVYSEPLQGDGHEAMVSAMSRGLERLGWDISEVIRSRQPR